MAKFSHYAIAAARQAINDAQWTPETDLEKQRTVRTEQVNQSKNFYLLIRIRVFVLGQVWVVWKIL
jgi:hypothetical protein